MARRTRHRYRRLSNRDLAGAGFGMLLLLSLVLRAVAYIAELPTARQVAFYSLLATLLVAVAIVVKPLLADRSRSYLLEQEIRDLNPTQFEQRVALLCQHLGWTQVRQMGGAGDEGVDVFGTYQGKRYVIQCKKYKDIVQPERVRELLGTMRHHHAQGAILATTGRFGPGSVSFAKEHNLELWDGETLGEKLHEAEERQQDPMIREREAALRKRVLSGLVIWCAISLLSTLVFR